MDKDKILSKAKIGLMQYGSTFLCTIAFSLRYVWDTKIPTAGVNGTDIRINPDWFCGLQSDERIGLLAHESWHMALDHVGEKGRRGKREATRYNIAGDHVINLLVTAAGMKIPPQGYCDQKYKGWSTNKVYDDLPDNPNDTCPWGGDVMEVKGNLEELSVHITQILVKASLQSEMSNDKPGDIPGEIQRALHDLLNPILPWESLIDRFFTDMSDEDYSWRKPNRRFMPEVILPTRHSETLGHIIIAIDTSGSVSNEQINKMLTEIDYIKSKFNPKKLTILDCDTQINNIFDVTESDDISDLKFKGGGGTLCAPPIDYAIKHNAQALLYFTDGYFTPYKGTVDFPILWLIYDNPTWQTNIGEVVIYNG